MREYADIEKSSHSSLSQTIHHNPSSMPTSFNANPEMLHLNTSTQATTGTSMVRIADHTKLIIKHANQI